MKTVVYDLMHIVENEKKDIFDSDQIPCRKKKDIMSLIEEDSVDSARSELELFEIKPTQMSIDWSRFEHFYPLTIDIGPRRTRGVTSQSQ